MLAWARGRSALPKAGDCSPWGWLEQSRQGGGEATGLAVGGAPEELDATPEAEESIRLWLDIAVQLCGRLHHLTLHGEGCGLARKIKL